jgi:hypothetical protein
VVSGFDLLFVDLESEPRPHVDGAFGIEFSRHIGTSDRVHLVAEGVDVLGIGFERVLFHLAGAQDNRVGRLQPNSRSSLLRHHRGPPTRQVMAPWALVLT